MSEHKERILVAIGLLVLALLILYRSLSLPDTFVRSAPQTAVQMTTDAVSYHFANHRVASFLAMGLYGIADIAQTIAVDGLLNAQIQRLLRSPQQIYDFFVNLANSESIS